MGAPGLSHRPCGACSALVPVATGCSHWKPGTTRSKRVGWTRVEPHPVVIEADYQVLDSQATGRIG